MSSTTVYPNADGTKTGWTGTGDVSNLYNNVKNGVDSPNDSTYNTGSNTPLFFSIGDMPSDFSVATAVTLKIRAFVTRVKSNDRQFSTLSLTKSDESTAITADGDISSVTATITNYTVSPSITGATDKTSWDGAKIKIGAPTGTSGAAVVCELQIEITYTTTSGDVVIFGGVVSQMTNFMVTPGKV